MRKIALFHPPCLVFGEQAFDQFISDYLSTGHTRLYLVSIAEVQPQIQSALDQLREQGVEVKVNTQIKGEPSVGDYERLLTEARTFEADSVVGLGGGSVLDVAKLLAAQLNNSQELRDIMGIRKLQQRNTYLACIPTTSGTGSEVSPNALIIDEKGAKVGIISPFLVPDASYVDPALTKSVPASVTAATGIDALAHCLEAYTNQFAHPVVDLFALEGIRLIGNHLKEACQNGANLEARSQVALGSLYGGMCLGPVNTAAAHALAYPLGTRYHIPHGLSVAVLLPYVMDFNLEAAPERYAEVALALGVQKRATALETAREGVERIKGLLLDCGLPLSLDALNIPREHIREMAAESVQIERLLKNNIRPITLTDAEQIYKSAFNIL